MGRRAGAGNRDPPAACLFGRRMGHNETKSQLSGRHIRAAVLCAEDELSDEAIAANVGIGRATLNRWRELPEFAAEVERQKAAILAKALRLPIAKKHERLRVLNELHDKQLALIGARSTQYPDVPGADTGLIVGTLKQVKHITVSTDEGTQTWTEEHWEYQFDAALVREIRATQEQAAKETGDWSETLNMTGTVAVRLIGVDPVDI